MGNSDSTKQLLAEELKRQCRTTQFNRITIGELCSACGLDRRTFYYHFRDIYDLAAWVFNHSLASFLPGEDRQPGVHGMEEALRLMKKDAPFYRRALADNSQNSLGLHILAFCADAYKNARKHVLGGALPETELFSIDFFCFGSLGMIHRWLSRDCNPDPAQLAALIFSVMPEELQQLYLAESGGSSSARKGK